MSSIDSTKNERAVRRLGVLPTMMVGDGGMAGVGWSVRDPREGRDKTGGWSGEGTSRGKMNSLTCKVQSKWIKKDDENNLPRPVPRGKGGEVDGFR